MVKKKKKRRKKGESVKTQEKLWVLCKKYIRQRYPNECYTCGAEGLAGVNWQTGHYIAKGNLKPYLKYDPRVLRPQCMLCNKWHGGMGADYHIRLVQEEGQEYVDGIHKDRDIHMSPKENLQHYKDMIDYYTAKLN